MKNENRKTNRRDLGNENVVVIEVNGKKMEVMALDVSPEGMRIRLPEFMGPKTEIYCMIDIFENTPPFYAKGTVVRAFKYKDQWEAGIKFHTVRVYDFKDEKKV
jgi:hypothetical protein